MPGVTNAHVTFIFESADESAHEVSAATLGAALLGISSLCEAANRVLNENKTRAQVAVVANPKEGSLEVELGLTIVSHLEGVKALFSMSDVKDALEILRLLGFSTLGAGALAVLKKLKGEKPKKIEAKGESEAVVYTKTETITVPKDVIPLLNDLAVRAAIERIATAAADKEVTRLVVVSDSKPAEVITRDDLPALRAPTKEELIAAAKPVVPKTVRRAAIRPVKIWLEDNQQRKWQFSDGAATFNAEVHDPDFLDRVERGRRFGNRDLLDVELEVESLQLPGGEIHTNYSVLKVHRIIEGSESPTLFETPPGPTTVGE
jgi:hypothetical protein